MAAAMDRQQLAVDQAGRVLDRLAFHIHGATRSCNAERIHDLRVAIRRFTQVLLTLRDCLNRRIVKAIRKTLKRFMTLAGNVRNYDIAMDFVQRFDASDVALAEALQSRRKEAEAILLRELKRWVAQRLSFRWRDELKITRADEPLFSQAIEELLSSRLPKMAERFFRHGERVARANPSGGELHEFRLATKKLRYTLEYSASVYETIADPLLEQIRSVQAILGDINDCRTVSALLKDRGGNRLVEAALKRRRRRKTKEFRRLWAENFSGGGVKQWMKCLRLAREGASSPRKPMSRSALVSVRQDQLA